MASRIIPTNIDGTFPIAGQDNSSQGFRDNFTNIKNNFTFARNEITDLQSKAILISALEGTTLNNDMAGTQIVRPQLKAWTQALVNLGELSGTAVVDFNAGNFHKVTTAGSISMSLVNWPTSIGSGALGYGAVRVWFVVTDVAHKITLPTTITIGVTDITGYDEGTRSITFDRVGNYIFDFSSIDGGANYFISDPMRNRDTLRSDTTFVSNIITEGGHINKNFAYVNLVDNQHFVANVSYQTIFFDTANSAPISNARVTLPATAENGREIVLSFLAPVTDCWINKGNIADVKWSSNTVASTGNVSVKYIYSTAAGNWLRS